MAINKFVNRRKVITKNRVSEDKQYALMRDKVKELKQEFRKYNQGSMGELFRLCDEIVRINRELPENRGVGKSYTFRSLEWDEDLNLSSMEIRYIEAYKYISDFGLKCVKEGKIHDSTICHFLALSSLLRQEKYQNKLIRKIIKDKIKISQVSELTKSELILFLDGKLQKRMSDDYFFTATKSIRSIKKRILDRKELLKDSNFSDNLFKAIEDLYNQSQKIKEQIK